MISVTKNVELQILRGSVTVSGRENTIIRRYFGAHPMISVTNTVQLLILRGSVVVSGHQNKIIACYSGAPPMVSVNGFSRGNGAITNFSRVCSRSLIK